MILNTTLSSIIILPLFAILFILIFNRYYLVKIFFFIKTRYKKLGFKTILLEFKNYQIRKKKISFSNEIKSHLSTHWGIFNPSSYSRSIFLLYTHLLLQVVLYQSSNDSSKFYFHPYCRCSLSKLKFL